MSLMTQKKFLRKQLVFKFMYLWLTTEAFEISQSKPDQLPTVSFKTEVNTETFTAKLRNYKSNT